MLMSPSTTRHSRARKKAAAGVRRISVGYSSIALFNAINIYFPRSSGQLTPRLQDKVRLQEIVRAMADSTRHLLICSCADTMPLDADTVRPGCRAEPTTATQLCRAELDRFRAIAAEDTPLTVGCTQEAAVFSEVAAEGGGANPT